MRIDESREMDAASRRTFAKLGDLATLAALQNAPLNRNLLDNGAFIIAQRGTSFAGVTGGGFKLDRWQLGLNTLGTWTLSQTLDAPANTEFNFCHKFLVTTADAAPAAADFALVQQQIEGQNLQHLLWGTTSAKPLVLSFWVKSNVPGTYIAELYRAEGAGDRHIGIPYTITVANAWEFKTLVYPGDTTTETTNDTVGRMRLVFWFDSGANFDGGATLQTNWGPLAATSRVVGGSTLGAAVNNFIQFAGVQLEVGTTPTAFQTKTYGDELLTCMRYFQKWTQPPLKGTTSPGANQTFARASFGLPISMRAKPTPSITAALPIYDGVVTGTANAIINDFCTATVCELQFSTTIVAAAGSYSRPVSVYQDGSTSSLELAAEI